MLRYFLQMLYAPRRTVARVLDDDLGFGRIAMWVAIAGLVRGLVEGLWILMLSGRFQVMLARGEVGYWYLIEAGPFSLANVLTGLFRWGMFAIIPYALGRFSGGRGQWRDFLRVYGVAMGIYVVTILPNFAYLSWDLPTLQFQVSRIYSPMLGVGQVLTSIWLAWFGYVTVRHLHGSSRLDSALIGIAVPIINVGALIVLSRIFFNLKPVHDLPRAEVFWISTIAFIIAAFLAIPILFWFGGRLARRENH